MIPTSNHNAFVKAEAAQRVVYLLIPTSNHNYYECIGCVPCGSGNDYVRNFGTQAQFLDLDAQLAAQPFAADVIRTPQGCGIDIYAAGIDAQVANGIPKWRRVPFCGCLLYTSRCV